MSESVPDPEMDDAIAAIGDPLQRVIAEELRALDVTQMLATSERIASRVRSIHDIEQV